MALSPKVVLIVEDDAILCMGMALALKRRGYSTKTARNGEGAMEAFRDGVDLVVMDIDLGPSPDGVSIAKEMLSTVQVPIVFHCASPYSDHTDRLEGLRYAAYVEKDVDQEYLYACVDRALAGE